MLAANHEDPRIPDMRGSSILEKRNNTFGSRSWADSQCGWRDPLDNVIPPRMGGVEWMKKWTSNSNGDQAFGYRHRRDTERERAQSLPVIDDSWKKRHYIAPPGRDDAVMYVPRYPNPSWWKVNQYGNTCPARYPGGISTWLASRSDILWSHSQKWNKERETSRVLNPVSTKGVLQARVRL